MYSFCRHLRTTTTVHSLHHIYFYLRQPLQNGRQDNPFALSKPNSPRLPVTAPPSRVIDFVAIFHEKPRIPFRRGDNVGFGFGLLNQRTVGGRILFRTINQRPKLIHRFFSLRGFLTAPVIVPVPIKSPVRMGQPASVWKVS